VRQAQAFCEKEAATAIVAFDPSSRVPEEAPQVGVRVAQRAQSADDVIRAIVDASAEASLLTVVTSDKPLYSYARTRGAHVLRCHEWKKRARA
jgi:hypothetical protein